MTETLRLRREPPLFRSVEVARVAPLSARMLQVTLAGPALEGFTVDQPAASVRLLLPSAAGAELVVPTWNGNEFLLPDGSRPVIRTFTPRRSDPAARQVDIDVVVHGHGVASRWASAATPGTPAALSGPGRGYDPDPDAAGFLLAGDETALAAIAQLLEVLPPTVAVDVHVEIADAGGRLELPAHPGATVRWHERAAESAPGDALVAAVAGAAIGDGTRVWAAGEAAAVQRLRRQLFEERGVPRRHAVVRGYWKAGRAGDADDPSA